MRLAALVAISGAVILAAALGGASARVQGLPQAGRIVSTLRFSPHLPEVITARDGSLFALVFRETPRRVDVVRWGSAGDVTRRRMTFPLSYYLSDMSAGPYGVYAGTGVLRRFTNAPDRLLRIDPMSLAIRARAYFRGRVTTVEQGRSMWATIGDGRVVRLDPLTLRVQASQRLAPVARTVTGDVSLSNPALGLGSLWVLTGNKLRLELVRLNPASLAVLSRTLIPKRSNDVFRILGNAHHVYLLGDSIVRVDRRGKLIGRPTPAFQISLAAQTYGNGLVAVVGVPPKLVVLDSRGRTVARTDLHDAGGPFAVSGGDAWVEGNAGQGNGLVHIRLIAARPSS
jgi:hypothetical protein